MRFNDLLVLCLLLGVGLAGCKANDDFDDFDDAEVWEAQPFYGELRFRVVGEGDDTLLPDATLQVSGLRIEELADADSVGSDEDGLIVIHQLERGTTYTGDAPSQPAFTFSAPGHLSQSYSVEELAAGTAYDPYRPATDLPTTTYEDEELPVYEFTIRLPADGTTDSPISAPVDEDFQLAYGQTATVEGEGLSVRFAAVDEDSRCPSDVECIWAGQVTIRVAVKVGEGEGKNVTLTLQPGALDPATATASQDGYTITLVGVEPYPVSTEAISFNDYVATLRVTR